MRDSICYLCRFRHCTYKGCPETQWEPEEPPEYECYLDSENFMSEDGCCNYQKDNDLDNSDSEFDYDREVRYHL